MNTKMRVFLCCGVLGVAIDFARAGVPDNDVTFTLVPVGGISATGAQTITVEAFVTANATLRFESGVWDVPCAVTPQPGGSGIMTATGGCADCDGDGDNTSSDSSGSVPFLFGPSGASPYSTSQCATEVYSCLSCPVSVFIFAGVSRYMGAVS